MNMAKKIRTENSYPVLVSKLSEYAQSNHHFAIALQKTAVFDEKLYFWSLTNFKKVIFQIYKKKHKKMLKSYFYNNENLIWESLCDGVVYINFLIIELVSLNWHPLQSQQKIGGIFVS